MGETRNPPRNRIIRGLAKKILLFVLVFSLLLTFLKAFWDYKQRVANIDQTMEQIRGVKIQGIITALWNVDKPLLKALLEGTTQFPYLNYAAILDQKGIIVESGKKKDQAVITREFPLSREYKGRPLLLGRLYLQADSTQILNEVRDKILEILLFQAVLVGLVAFFLFMVFERLVTSHLFKIVDYLNQIDFGPLTPPLTLDKKPAHDEIDNLADSINQMRTNLAEAYEKQRQAQEKIEESEARFRILVEQAPDAISIFDVEKNQLVEANTNSEKLFGCSREELLKPAMQRFYAPNQPDGRPIEESMAENIKRVLAGESLVFERAIRNARGQELICEVRLVRFPSVDRQLIRNSFIDISQRKEAEKALRESEEKYRIITENMRDTVWLMDMNLVVTWASPSLIRNRGFTLEELAALPLEKHLTSASLVLVQSLKAQYLTEEALQDPDREIHFDLALEFIRKDGSVYWTETVVTLLRNPDGSPKGFLCVGRDITDRKRAEVEIQKLNAELEQRVRERTAELMAVNKELEGFNYSIAHDLRAPLRHLTGFASLLTRQMPEGLDEKSRHYLDVISHSAIKMGRLIDDVLSFSGMGRVEMNRTPVNMKTLLEDSLKLVQSELRGREIDWSIGPLPEVYGDPVLLTTVLTNLLLNALKFTHHKPRAVIEIGHLSDPGDEEVFFVKDNGAGFDMRYKDKLFGLFHRLHHENEFEGTGLGLANIRRIIERHGGRVWAEGGVGEGATFYFSLPKRDLKKLKALRGGV